MQTSTISAGKLYRLTNIHRAILGDRKTTYYSKMLYSGKQEYAACKKYIIMITENILSEHISMLFKIKNYTILFEQINLGFGNEPYIRSPVPINYSHIVLFCLRKDKTIKGGTICYQLPDYSDPRLTFPVSTHGCEKVTPRSNIYKSELNTGDMVCLKQNSYLYKELLTGFGCYDIITMFINEPNNEASCTMKK